MFERFRVNEVNLKESDFVNYSEKQLIDVFKKNNNITIELKNKDIISITYVTGTMYGIRFAEVVSFIHKRPQDNSYLDLLDDDVKYHVIENKPLNPLDIKKVMKTLLRYYNNLKEGKKTFIRDLTEEEKDKIVEVLNRPIYDVEEVFA